MIKEAIGIGDSIEEAKEKAIAALNAKPDDDIQFEVVAFPKKKTLGLFGGSKAQVKVFVEIADVKPKAQKNNLQKPKQGVKPAEKVNNKEVSKPKASQPSNEKKEQAPKKENIANKPVKAQEGKVIIADDKTLSGYGEAVDGDMVPSDTQAGKAVAYLKAVLANLGCTDVVIKVATKDEAALITIEGGNLGVIIGHRGETLDALQYLTSLSSNSGSGYYKITLNIGNYREKRQEALYSLAKRVSSQVLKTGRSRALEPMNPYERRIIHTAIQEIQGVESNSIGAGPGRKVVISTSGSFVPRTPRSNDGFQKRTAPSEPVSREPKKDSDIPLYGKINK